LGQEIKMLSFLFFIFSFFVLFYFYKDYRASKDKDLLFALLALSTLVFINLAVEISNLFFLPRRVLWVRAIIVTLIDFFALVALFFYGESYFRKRKVKN